MADPARGMQNRRDFLSASPRAGCQGGWGWIVGGGGSWSLGHSWSPSAWRSPLPPSPRQGYCSLHGAHSLPPMRGPGVTASPAAPGHPPNPEQSTARPWLAQAAWHSLLDDLLRPLNGNIIRLCKTRDRLWGKPGQLCSSSAVAVAVTMTTPAQGAFVGQTQSL